MSRKSLYGKFTSLLLIFIILFSDAFSLVGHAAQANLLGSNAALGSPLMSDEFTVDNWNSWEMLCFGIFLSNFCQPFEDDYNSAFTEGSNQGTQGRGLKALQFAAGGDVNASGYLADMVSYCKQSQAEAYKPLYVRYGYYEYDENVANDVTGALRVAYLDDLIPQLVNFQRDCEDKISLASNARIQQPTVAYGILQDYDNLSSNQLNKTYVDYAVLPTFYASSTKNEDSVIFDMTENYDIQILKALFAKAFDKYAASDYSATEEEGMDGDKTLNEKLKSFLGRQCPLVLDTFGNICVKYNGRQIIVIPASANQHITKTSNYNYVNSLVLNNFVLSNLDSNIVVNSKEEPISSSTGILWWKETKNSVGNFPVKHTDEIEDGRLLITSDTDSQLMKYIYSVLKEQEPKKDVAYSLVAEVEEGAAELAYKHNTYPGNIISEFGFGKAVSDLFDENSRKNQAIQFHITGANSIVKETKRDVDETSIETALGVYGLLSTLFTEEGDNAEVLDYFYAFEADTKLEDTKMSLFSDCYYLAPSLTRDDADASKLYLNYFCKAMSASSPNLVAEINNIFTTEIRDSLYNNLKAQKGFRNTWLTMISSDNAMEVLEEKTENELKANVIYKSFLKEFYKSKENSNYSNLTNFEQTISEVEGLFDISEPLVSSYDMKYQLPSDAGADYDSVTRVVKVYKPSSGFQALASVFGLEDGCQFELYSPYIYVTYLDFYGLLSGSTHHNFNEKIFDNAFFKNFKAENFSNGKTKEQMENETKVNVYKLLSLDEKGKAYRKSLFSSIIESTFVEPLDDALNKGSIGNVGAETSFLKVSMLEDNFLIGDIIKEHWKTIGLTLFGLLTLIAIVCGAFTNKSIGWYLAVILSSTCLTFSIPYYLDIAPIVIEKYVNSHYKNAGSYWSLAESVEYDKSTADLSNSGEDKNKLISMLNTLNFLDTDSSLMVKLDISQKVISNTGLNNSSYNELQRMKTLRWLLPSLMKQMSSSGNSHDYVSVPVTRLYDNFSKIWLMYNSDDENSKNLELSSKESLWYGDENKRYKSTAPAVYGASNSTKSISRVTKSTAEPTHTQFYMLDGLTVQSVYNTLNKDYITKEDWQKYAERIASNDGIQPHNFVEKANSMLTVLNTYNQYTGDTQQEFGYLWTTENLGTYFYTLAKDTFNEAGEGGVKNLKSLLTQLQGSYDTDAEGNQVITSFMHYENTGYERDVCDMEEVFTNLMPYMYQLMIMANGTSDHNGLLGSAKMVGNAYYSDNYLSWLFRCNWITKIYEDNLYSSSAKVRARDENGEITGEYRIENISEPRCYPEERPMVFSEAQMHQQHLTKEDLTFTELKILDFNSDVIRRWTSLVNYANTEGLKKEHMYRQMAMEALFAFNETFTRDNIIMTEKTLYPTSFDLRSISLITILRSLVCNLTGSNSYMYGNMALELYRTNGFINGYLALFIIYASFIFFGWLRDCYMILAFISAVATLIFNFGSSSRNKIKSMFGCIISSVLYCLITMTYYWLINFLIGNPKADMMVNFQMLFSSKLSLVPFWLWSLTILLLTFAYTAIIVIYFYQLWIGHKFGLSIKDGGFGFYYQLADKVVGSITGAVDKVGNRFGSRMNGLRKSISSLDLVSDNSKSQKVRTEKDKPLEVVNKTSGNNYSLDLSGVDFNSSYNSGQVGTGINSILTEEINEKIRTSKKSEASRENAARAEIKE